MEYKSSNGWTFDFDRMVCFLAGAKKVTYLILRESECGIEYEEPYSPWDWQLLIADAADVNRAYAEYVAERELFR